MPLLVLACLHLQELTQTTAVKGCRLIPLGIITSKYHLLYKLANRTIHNQRGGGGGVGGHKALLLRGCESQSS